MLVRDLSSKGLQPQAERVMPVPVPDAAAAPSIPLAGDLVAAMTKRMGIDWVVKTVADELGVDCGCPERQQKLNALDARFRRFLGW